ncbi:probable proline synthetase associated protein [Chondrus crispus]|uniref:Pyridoxal phosphate homeostasis protein n=1 Tax=Chondrus crispus TaxID=2769 RepID=R7QR84_CHOCR|nr:probable proline synthetase associated protein [Chondrus crispus]CDF40659.1 probable proline synthetase associated protein [Chondrus crispus]|eukprot:XP_005710953.1 probable proline synthetase associated protein [Chondrus crispus]
MSSETTSVTNGVAEALRRVQERITAAASGCGRPPPELVAVSKTKPVELLLEAYEAGQRSFGENYVQEIVAKSPQLPSDIKWHFIGGLQSNKAKVLAGVPNLYMVESVDRQKTATALNKAFAAVGRAEKLKVMVQVNTSGEESKSGCQPGETAQLAKFVDTECDNLELVGLMTIGAFDTSDEPEAFKILATERDAVAEVVERAASTLTLSMGMSADFEAAIRMGSDSVRVGSTIFGAREYPPK